ncbi:hypothetical protein PS2_027209 [Malus domestica]
MAELARTTSFSRLGPFHSSPASLLSLSMQPGIGLGSVLNMARSHESKQEGLLRLCPSTRPTMPAAILLGSALLARLGLQQALLVGPLPPTHPSPQHECLDASQIVGLSSPRPKMTLAFG